MITRFAIGIHPVTYLALLLEIGSVLHPLNSPSADVRTGYEAKVVSLNTQHIGSVDRRVLITVTNRTLHRAIGLICLHSPLSSDWNIEIDSIEVGAPDRFDEAMAGTIADSIRITEGLLKEDRSLDPVACVVLPEEKMPQAFMQPIYLSLAAQMGRSSGQAAPAYDRHLRKMLQTAFDENHCIRLIRKRLEEIGFSFPRACPPELVAVRPEFTGKAWKRLSGEKAAGLKTGSATAVLCGLAKHKLH